MPAPRSFPLVFNLEGSSGCLSFHNTQTLPAGGIGISKWAAWILLYSRSQNNYSKSGQEAMAAVGVSICACEEEFGACTASVQGHGGRGYRPSFSLPPSPSSSWSHLGGGALGAIGQVRHVAGLGTGIAEEQSDPRVVHWLSASLKDAMPQEGTDQTQHTWVSDATQVASWFHRY